MAKSPAPVLGIEPLLTLNDMAAIYRISPLTIRRRLYANTFRPLPYVKYPYRWNPADVKEDLARRQPKQKTRRHGFAATKARRELDAVGTE